MQQTTRGATVALMCRRWILLLLFFGSIPAFAQVNFSGTVVDDIGEPLIGVSVIVQNTTIGTTTDEQGHYSINVTPPAVLSYSYLGYAPFTIDVDASNPILDVILYEDVIGLEEVVVTGTSEATTKKQLGNAISTVNSRELERAAALSVDKALAGKIAGALINQNSGNPAGGMSVTLRGYSTIYGNSNPLYIVDGVIIDNSSAQLLDLGGYSQNRLVDINPDDIERIEVIKGAAAAAIYGSRASNGVVQIFTKKGKTGKPKISFNTSVNFNSLRKEIEENMEPWNWAEPGNPANDSLVPVTRYKMQDYVFQSSMGTDNNISISGGSTGTQYFVSGAYFSNDGIIPNTNFKRYSSRVNITQELNSWLSADVGVNYTHSNSSELPNGGISEFYGALTGMNFNHNAYDPEPDASGNYTSPQGWVANPLEVINTFDFEQKVNRFGGKVKLTATPFDGFSIDYLIGLDQYGQQSHGFIPVGSNGKNTGWVRAAIRNAFLLNQDLNLKYSTDLSDVLQSTSRLGFTVQQDRYYSLSETADKLSPVVGTTSAGTLINNGESTSERIIQGAFFQQTFGLANKLFLTGAIRVDGASSFGESEKVQSYPKFGLSYVVSEEDFWKEGIGRMLNTFKLRASYGEAGNMTVLGPYDRFTNYSPQPYVGNTGLIPGTKRGNQNIKPERQKELEIGFDLGLLNNRFGLEFSYFNVNVEDLVLSRVLAPSTGYSEKIENVGTMTNSGFELLARGSIVRNKQFNWLMTANFSKIKNEVNDIDGDRVVLPNTFGIIVAENGNALGVMHGYYFARNEDGSILLDDDGLPTRAKDESGANDRKIIADPNPDWTGSLINEFSYKNFGLSFQFDAVQGFDIFNFTDRVSSRPLFGGGHYDAAEIRGELPRGYNKAAYNIWERFIEDGSFVKLRELAFSYRLAKVPKGLSGVKVYVTGRNLLSFDNYSGWDPETSTAGQTNGVRGFDFNEVPIPRTWKVGVKLDF